MRKRLKVRVFIGRNKLKNGNKKGKSTFQTKSECFLSGYGPLKTWIEK